MVRVVRPTDAEFIQVRPIPRHTPRALPPLTAIEAELSIAREELRSVQSERDDLTSQVERAKTEVEIARRDGEAAGYSRGLSEGADRGDAALALLSGGLDQAVAALRESLVDTEGLAAAIAGECLNKLIGDSAHHDDLVSRSIHNAVSALEAGAILRIEVAFADFADDAALALLFPEAHAPTFDVRADASLPSGACRITLTLGEVEVGIAQQWRRLAPELVAIADAGRGP